MFNNLGWGEIAVLGFLALLIFGPERLPDMAAKAGRGLRQLRTVASGLTDDLKREIGDDTISTMRDTVRDLDPRRWLDEAPSTQTPREKPLAQGERAPYDPDAT